MTDLRVLVSDDELQPHEWLRRYALTKLKYAGDDKARVLEIADLLRDTELVREALRDLLDHIAVTIKGPPEPGHVWGFHDLLELVQLLKDGKPLPPNQDATVQ